ncbi:hypothetical protein Gohar_027523 [Gossypium harknessii]|nr:hypothetical protein [Gossypium harknessii]
MKRPEKSYRILSVELRVLSIQL